MGSAASADIVLGVEAGRLAIALRHGDDAQVLVLDRLEQRLGRAPEIVERRIVMRRHVDVGLVGAHVLERLCNRLRVEIGGGDRDQPEIDAADALHRRLLEIRDAAAAVAIHDAKAVIERQHKDIKKG